MSLMVLVLESRVANPALEAVVLDNQVLKLGAGYLATDKAKVQLEDGKVQLAQASELLGRDAVRDGDFAQHALVAGLAAVQDEIGDELADPRLGGGLLDVEVRGEGRFAGSGGRAKARYGDTRRMLEDGQGKGVQQALAAQFGRQGLQVGCRIAERVQGLYSQFLGLFFGLATQLVILPVPHPAGR